MLGRKPSVQDCFDGHAARTEHDAARRFLAPISGVAFDPDAQDGHLVAAPIPPETMKAKRPAVKLLCDEMLARLGRYLRAAGYDTEIGEAGLHDRTLLERAIAENRILITCDRAMLSRRHAAGRVMILSHGALDDSVEALSRRLGIDWLHAPFTRCLVDNARLGRAATADRKRLPERARAAGGPVRICPVCGRLYWPGSHVQRMTARLRRWAGTDASSEGCRAGSAGAEFSEARAAARRGRR